MTTLAQVDANPGAFSPEEVARVREAGARKLALVLPPQKAGESGIIRSLTTPDGPVQWNRDKAGKPQTMWEGFQRGKTIAGASADLFGVKRGSDYVYESWESAETRAKGFGSGLLKLGLRSAKDMVGIMLGNSPEWYTADLACVAYNYVSVPLYVTGDDQFTLHIVNMCELPIVVLSQVNLARMIRLKAENKTPTVAHLVIVGHVPTDAERAAATAAGIALHGFEDLVSLGARSPAPITPVTDPSAPFSIISTSGTTGNPKGSILTHGNITFAMHVFGSDPGWTIGPSDTWFSYLPSAHAADRLASWSMMYAGLRIAFGTGNVADLLPDMQAAKPTVLVMVPRILNRVVGQIKAMVDAQGPQVKGAFDAAYAAKRKLLLGQGIVTRETEWDQKVFGRMQALLGGKVRYITAGAAAVDVNALEFGRIVFGCPFIEAFGQTEGSAITSTTGSRNPYTPHGSNVGIPYSYLEVKLVDVPELGYRATDRPNPRGEILVRGPNVFAGYYKEPSKTAETVDREGWLAMGDVAELLPDGTLRIIDRAKNVFKLNQGEFVAPEKIETILMRSPWLAQAFVYGEIVQRWLVAVLAPDPERVLAWGKAKGKTGGLVELCADPELVAQVYEDVAAVGKANGLLGYEIPKAIVLYPGAFTVEEGLITASLKNKRSALKDKFDKDLRAMYASIRD
ncbi:hypothetical protein DFJ74DRAFT_677731 [Hyaloraphidium curvatum]|nr:hypothetical protein DFJ74DRAFT_677731 [Hyaloraphidium curvatum]